MIGWKLVALGNATISLNSLLSYILIKIHKEMAKLKIAIGERLNVQYRQYFIFNDKDKTYFKKSMNTIRAYDFMKILKTESINPEECETRIKKYKCVDKLKFNFKKF